MFSFIPPRDRDAWSTIRGYVYQIDLTIQRWLSLAPHQILELERGEDIDVINSSLTADVEERDRLLEQVKHRENSLTLRTSEAVSAIANFIEHRHVNPTADIVFQFTTNTQIGREKQSPMPDRIPAIEAWTMVQSGKLEEKTQDEFIKGIREILKGVAKPSDLHQDTWQQFYNFNQAATDEQFKDLIYRFQWKTKAPEARSLKSILQQELLNRGHAIDFSESQEQYHRLFWYVFSCLCQRGIKRLTSEELNTQLTLPSLSRRDHATLEILKAWSNEIEARIIELEYQQQQSSQLVERLDVEVKQLAKAQGIDKAIDYTVETLVLDIPPLAERSSLREETVQDLVAILTEYTWIAINGSLGSGKTQLVILIVQYLISQEFYKNCVWLRFRDLTIEQACLRFDQAVEKLVGSPLEGNLGAWYAQLGDHFSSSTIWVLDDLPRLSRGDELEIRLIQLARTFHDRGICLLSTSFYQLSQNLQATLNDQILFPMQVPPFTNSEAQDLLIAYDAPDFFVNQNRASYLNGLANQNPSLLAAIAEYLNRQNWYFTPETFNALLRGDYTAGINEETLHQILLAIQDEPSQELLYRLNLVLGYFSLEDVQALAEVFPSIERPRQRLYNLMGVWIQRDVDNRLMVSPLVKALGSHDLSTSVSRDCHLTLGKRIVSSELNQYKAFNAIFHFTVAEAFDRAGGLLVFALDRLENSETKVDDGGLLELWASTSLPEQMSLGIRLLIRRFQISINANQGENIAYFLNDLDDLIERSTAQESAILMGITARFASKCSEQVGFTRLKSYFQLALRFSSRASLPDGTELSLLQDNPFESLIWIIAWGIQTPADLESWMATLEQMNSEQLERALSARSAEAGCLYVAEKLWLRESDKPEVERNWQSTLAATHNLADSASSLGLELLWACAICSEVIIYAEYIGNLNQAIEIAGSAMSEASGNPRVQFLLKECLGRQYIFADRCTDAIDLLSEALEQPTEAYSDIRFLALLRLSRAIADQEPYLAIQYAQQSVNLARSSEKISDIAFVKALGELAIAKWLAIDLSAAFEVWDQASEYLLKSQSDKASWKNLFVLFSHINGYFTALATTNHPPTRIESGEHYAAPVRGIFLSSGTSRADLYDPVKDCLLPVQLALMSEALGNDNRALFWALKGIEMARESGLSSPLVSLHRNIIPQLVLESRYDEALDLAVEAGQILTILPQLPELGLSILEPGINVKEILDSNGNSAWQLAEICAIIPGILPIIFHIANLAIYHPEDARNKALELADICRRIPTVLEFQSPWITVAEIVDQIYLQPLTCTELIEQYESSNFPDTILLITGLMAATLQENAPLFEVLRVHISILDRVQELVGAQSTTYRRIILPYLFNYWIRTVEQVMFRFNEPQLTASLLLRAQNLPPDQQGQAILLVVQHDLIV